MLDKLHQAVPSGFFFRHDNHRGAQYAVGQGVAFFHDADDGVRLLLADDCLHRLMLVRVEFVAGLRVDFFDMRSVERFLQFVQRHLHAHFQRVEIAALVEQRHFEIVFDRQHFGGEFLSGEFVRIGNFLLMAAAQVLLVCQTAQFAVF